MPCCCKIVLLQQPRASDCVNDLALGKSSVSYVKFLHTDYTSSNNRHFRSWQIVERVNLSHSKTLFLFRRMGSGILRRSYRRVRFHFLIFFLFWELIVFKNHLLGQWYPIQRCTFNEVMTSSNSRWTSRILLTITYFHKFIILTRF